MFKKLRFQHQLSIIFSAGILILALAATFVISKVSTDAMRERIVDESYQLTQAFAEQSTLALLYQSEDSAAEVTKIFLSFPDVVGAKILEKNMALLHASGHHNTDNINFLATPQTPVLLSEDSDAWTFIAPVYTQFSKQPLAGYQDIDSLGGDFDENQIGDLVLDSASDADPDRETVGYVKLFVGKDSLKRIAGRIFWYNLSVSIGLAFVLLLILLAITQRLTKPIKKLSQTMLAAQDGNTQLRAPPGGPRDIFEMVVVFNSMMDVLEHREKEIKTARDAAFESARAKGEFAANVSHELRTPMNGVLGMLELLPDFGLTEAQSEYVNIAKKSAQSLLTLIDNILDFSKNESQQISVELSEFSLTELLEDLIALLGSKAQANYLEYCYIIAADVPDCLIGDQEKIRQVMINLVGNALKFTKQGCVHIEVSMYAQTDKELSIRFCVKDTGIGVSEEAKERIFEAFSQADNSTTRRYGGTGLGLAISRQLVRLMGGSINIESEPGSGSEFWFTLPLQLGSQQLPTSNYPQLGAELDVLIINENQILIASISSMLSPLSIAVDTAGSLPEVIAKLENMDGKQTKYNMVIVDEGYTDFDRLMNKLSQYIELMTTTVVVLAHRSVTSRFIQHAEINHYLSKPIHRKQLCDCISAAFGSVAVTSKPATNAEQAHAETPTRRYRDKEILICEDNQTNYIVALRMLETLGSKAKLVTNGKECLQELERKRYDLILMDCHMPVMDGYEATLKIREQEEKSDRHIPIIAMTANTAEGEKEKCLAIGMDDYIPKPLSRLELSETIDRWLSYDEKETTVLSLKNLTREYGDQYIPNRRSDTQEVAASEPRVIDVKIFGELKMLLGDGINDVVRSFRDQLKSNLDMLEQAIISKDSEQVRLFSHSIKGSASNFGATRLVDISKQLEYEAKDGELGRAINRLDRIHVESNRVMEYLQAYL